MMRKGFIGVRVTLEEKQALTVLALRQGITLSECLRQLIRERAQIRPYRGPVPASKYKGGLTATQRR